MAMAVIKFWGYAKIVHRWLLSGGLVQTDICPVVFSRLGNKVYVNFYTEKTDLNRRDNLYQVWLSFCDDRLIAFAVQKYS